MTTKKLVNLNFTFNTFLKKSVILIGLVIVSILIIFIIELSKTNNTKISQTNNYCSKNNSTISNMAYNDLINNNIVNLSTIVNKIISSKNYNSDANCLYILTNYYISISNYTEAVNNFNDLVAIKSYTLEINSKLYHYKSILNIRQSLAFLKNLQKNINSNSINIPNK